VFFRLKGDTKAENRISTNSTQWQLVTL